MIIIYHAYNAIIFIFIVFQFALKMFESLPRESHYLQDGIFFWSVKVTDLDLRQQLHGGRIQNS